MPKYCEYSKYEQYSIPKYFKYRQQCSRVSNPKILQVQAVSRVFNPEILYKYKQYLEYWTPKYLKYKQYPE